MNTLLTIAQAARKHGWQVYAVGGWVRDRVLGIPSKDLDIEVFGRLTPGHLRSFLGQFGEVNAVGRSFGVFKLRTPQGDEVDVALPRRESKSGQGHKGFIVVPDPRMTPREAAARRDFTFNALMFEPLSGETLDFFGGVADLRVHRALRHIGPRFADDPLRVLRGFQFAGRFGLSAAPGTVALARSLRSEYATLPTERVWGEWHKWATRSVTPSLGLVFLDASGWLDFYPEVAALRGVPQDPAHHPEGDAWQHTLYAVDAMARIADREDVHSDDRAVLLFAALLHDMGKAKTTRRDGKGRWVSPGHAAAGVALAEQFLRRIGAPRGVVERVLPLVREHMAHLSVAGGPTPRFVRRLALRLAPATISEWAMVVEADHAARPPLPPEMPEVASRVLAIALENNVASAQPTPILMGRHLIRMGMRPGPEMGRILNQAFQAQIEGEFSDLPGALDWVKKRLTGKINQRRTP